MTDVEEVIDQGSGREYVGTAYEASLASKDVT